VLGAVIDGVPVISDSGCVVVTKSTIFDWNKGMRASAYAAFFMPECILQRKKTRHGSVSGLILRTFDEIHCSDMRLARRGSILFVLLKATEVLPMIFRAGQRAETGCPSLMVKVLLICGSDPHNIMMETGNLIACACVVCAQNRLTILSSPTAGTDERLGGSHAETPAERIPTASPW
jgi:hypothetical protein